MELCENEVFRTALKVAAILVCTVVATRLVRHMEKRIAKRRSTDGIGRKLLYRIAVGVIYCVGLLTAISQIQSLKSLVTTILAGSGIFAVVLGLAAQDGFSNIIGGLFLSGFKPFNVGDKVVLPEHSVTGYVEDISLHHTVIRTITGSRFVIPNGVMNSAVIENVNYEAEDGIISWVDISIAYDADVTKARELLAQMIAEHPMYYPILDENGEQQPVTVLLRNLGESGLDLRGTMRTKNLDDSFQACSDVREQAVRAFAEAGIEIPYNKLDVNLYQA